jgi:hypothetical protein
VIQTTDFTKWLRILLAEAFGVADAADAYFLDSGTSGLLGTIDTLSAEQASAAPTPEQGTIASHSGHVLFLLQLFDAYEHGQTPTPDWEGSWATRTVDEAAWRALRDDVRAAYEAVMADIEANSTWPEPRLAAAMTLLAHCAYHVGEIRQRLLWVTT